MPRFCPQCGHKAKGTAKFCNRCGAGFRQRSTPRPSARPSLASPPPADAAAARPRVESPAPASGYPEGGYPEGGYPEGGYPALGSGTDSSYVPPPQYWESYDYPSDSPSSYGSPGSSSTPASHDYGQPYSMAPRSDASRPLPPLSFGPTTSETAAREKAREIAKNFSLWAAGVVLFPVPFSDLVLLMPVQTAMVISIGKAYGVKDPPEKMLAHIAAACGASVFGQITTLFVANLIPIIGKLISAPFVYGWTYGLGEVSMRYFETQGNMDQDEMKSLFRKVSRDATRAFRPAEIASAEQSFEHLKDHLSEDEYKDLRSRFGQQ